MKKIICSAVLGLGFTISAFGGPIASNGQVDPSNPFSQFIGEYTIKSRDCNLLLEHCKETTSVNVELLPSGDGSLTLYISEVGGGTISYPIDARSDFDDSGNGIKTEITSWDSHSAVWKWTLHTPRDLELETRALSRSSDGEIVYLHSFSKCREFDGCNNPVGGMASSYSKLILVKKN